jgi:hypothetical protein
MKEELSEFKNMVNHKAGRPNWIDILQTRSNLTALSEQEKIST